MITLILNDFLISWCLVGWWRDLCGYNFLELEGLVKCETEPEAQALWSPRPGFESRLLHLPAVSSGASFFNLSEPLYTYVENGKNNSTYFKESIVRIK